MGCLRSPRRSRGRAAGCARRAAAIVGLAALMGGALLLPAGVAGAAVAGPPGVVYRPPVDGPIVDHFRLPACRWCPGNRGIDYAVAPGTPVRASAAGTVTFAGAIGDQRFVTVLHADGLRTTYAYLATIVVAAGQTVAQGAEVGTSGASLHFGVRRGSVYLDPELLLAGWRLAARLVPTDGARPARRWRRRAGRGAVGGHRRPARSVVDDRPVTSHTGDLLYRNPRQGRLRYMTARVSRRSTSNGPSAAAIRSPSERSESAPERRRICSATMARWPATSGPRHHERLAACGRPQGRWRDCHHNRRKETRTSWRRSSPCVSCSRQGCTSGTRPAGGTRR